MPGALTDLSDQQVACVYFGLSRMLRSGDATYWLHDERVAGPRYDGPRGARLPLPAGAEGNALYRTGHMVHGEVERRGREGVGRFLPAEFDWPFESWGAFCDAVSRSYDRLTRCC